MTTTENAPTAEPVLTVTWDTVIGARSVGYDYESETEQVEPVSLGEMVVAGLVERLIPQIKSDAEGWQGAVNQAREIANEVMREESAKIVREALQGEVRQTNRWGEAQGEPTTLRDLIREDVKAYLAETPRRDRYDERKGGFRELLRAEIDEAMTKELRGVIREARAAVAEQVRAKAADLFAAVVRKEV